MSDAVESLNGLAVAGGELRVSGVKKGRFEEEVVFDLLVGGELIAHVTYFRGRRDYSPWIEADIEAHHEELIKHLSGLLPPGSHLMITYDIDSETSRGLDNGVPPAATRLGYFLFKAGCTSFKDWYYSEGLREGDVKLQGNKPLNDSVRKEQLESIRGELEGFLEEKSRNKVFIRAQERARLILGGNNSSSNN